MFCGIDNLAHRTVAKYRKRMNIPAARFRKKILTILSICHHNL
ncbi:MAG: hypothetical protein JW787_04610 [Sedimentisphaerales bacterium]|nr:hypothetical protein [Sedimentisphaerales bacterium]